MKFLDNWIWKLKMEILLIRCALEKKAEMYPYLYKNVLLLCLQNVKACLERLNRSRKKGLISVTFSNFKHLNEQLTILNLPK